MMNTKADYTESDLQMMRDAVREIVDIRPALKRLIIDLINTNISALTDQLPAAAYWRHEADTNPTPDIWVGTETYDSGFDADYFAVALTPERCAEKLSKLRGAVVSSNMNDWRRTDDGNYYINLGHSQLYIAKEKG